MLYRSTDRLCRAGAPVQYLAHSASFQAGEKSAPSNSGIKHLGGAPPEAGLHFRSRLCLLATALPAALLALLAEPHGLGQLRARGGVVRGHHGVVAWQAEILAVLLGGHVVARAQVALEALVLLPVEQADQEVRGDRLFYRDGRLA